MRYQNAVSRANSYRCCYRLCKLVITQLARPIWK